MNEKSRQQRLEELRPKVQAGLDELDSGQSAPLDIEDIKHRGREQLAHLRTDVDEVDVPEFEKSSGNVFQDLGFPNPEIEKRQVELALKNTRSKLTEDED